MDKFFQLTRLLTILICLCTATGFAQHNKAALPPDANTEEAALNEPADQEVEVNEDNYRQFMELKDGLQQRNVLPENSYQSQAGLQKLDKLPEESQKHLRNQLREIIVQGDAWQPGDEEMDYPYAPSEAAGTNPPLQKQEAEAWGELVGNYHAREAEIYANSSRSRAAAASAGASSAPGTQTGNGDRSGTDSQGQGIANEQAAQPGSFESGDLARGSTADSYAPNAANDSGAQSTAGVSQSAMEYLQNNRSTAVKVGGSEMNTAGDSSNQSGEQSQELQQDAAAQEFVMDAPVIRISTEEPSAASAEGVSQNALEYLTGEAAQTGQEAEDTLSIEDLVNAQGLSIGVNASSAGGTTVNEKELEEQTPDKDSGD